MDLSTHDDLPVNAPRSLPAAWRHLLGRIAPPAGQRLNTWTHLAGVALGLALLAGLFDRCQASCDPVAAGGVAVFLATTLLLFCASVLCHGSRGAAQQQAWARRDHAATFLLIAGSYTPFATAQPRHEVHLLVLVLVWAAALVLSARQLLEAWPRLPPLGAYVALGWISVAAAAPVALQSGAIGLVLLLAGAALYSAGTVFYRNKAGWTHAHGAWHLLVVAGVAAHAAAVSRLPLA